MLKEGQTTRYLAYALGEIFLVVIGILLALHLPAGRQESTTGMKEEKDTRKISIS